MKVYLLIFVQLLIFSCLRAEITCWNYSSELSEEQILAFPETILSHNPDIICIRTENPDIAETILSSSHPHLFYDQELLIAAKTPIEIQQFTPFNRDNEGILELILDEKHVYIPIFYDIHHQSFWDIVFEKIFEDNKKNDHASFLFANVNGLSQLQRIEIINNNQSEMLLASNPRLDLIGKLNPDGTAKVEGDVTWNSTTSKGTKIEAQAGGEVTRDKEGKYSGGCCGKLTITPK